MGNITSPEALSLRWAEICSDPALQDLPYKIELNAWGKIEMSPASNRHARLQGRIGCRVGATTGGRRGCVVDEASVLTDIGVRVPDVAWASTEFMKAFGETTPVP